MSATLLNQEHHERFDRLQLAALAGLMLIGTLFVYSATMANPAMAALPWYDQTWLRQIVWYALGLGAGAALCLLDYHTLARWSFVAYWATIFFLVIVLIPHIGSMRFGARRWIDLGPFQFQPSEFAKLAFILAAAHFLSRPADELRQPANFWKGIGLLLLPFALILKEPDLGSALVLLPTGLVMMFVAGTPKSYLLKLAGAVGLLAALFLVDVAVCAAGLVADFHAAVSARPAAGLFWTGLHGFRSAERHAGGVATPPATTVGR